MEIFQKIVIDHASPFQVIQSIEPTPFDRLNMNSYWCSILEINDNVCKIFPQLVFNTSVSAVSLKFSNWAEAKIKKK